VRMPSIGVAHIGPQVSDLENSLIRTKDKIV